MDASSFILILAFLQVPNPVWVAEQPSSRGDGTQFTLRRSLTDFCTVSLRKDGGGIFIRAAALNEQGQLVLCTVGLSRATVNGKDEALILYFDYLPQNATVQAPLDFINRLFLTDLKTVKDEQIQWYLSHYPDKLESYKDLILRLKPEPAQEKATHSTGGVAHFFDNFCYRTAAAGFIPGTGHDPGITTPCGLCSIVSSTRECGFK